MAYNGVLESVEKVRSLRKQCEAGELLCDVCSLYDTTQCLAHVEEKNEPDQMETIAETLVLEKDKFTPVREADLHPVYEEILKAVPTMDSKTLKKLIFDTARKRGIITKEQMTFQGVNKPNTEGITHIGQIITNLISSNSPFWRKGKVAIIRNGRGIPTVSVWLDEQNIKWCESAIQAGLNRQAGHNNYYFEGGRKKGSSSSKKMRSASRKRAYLETLVCPNVSEYSGMPHPRCSVHHICRVPEEETLFTDFEDLVNLTPDEHAIADTIDISPTSQNPKKELFKEMDDYNKGKSWLCEDGKVVYYEDLSEEKE